MTSSEARHRPFELAKSKTPPLGLVKFVSEMPRPSFKFCSILLAGSAGNFLASLPGSFPLQPLNKSDIVAKKTTIFNKFFLFIMIFEIFLYIKQDYLPKLMQKTIVL